MIVIVEANTPARIAAARTRGLPSMAQAYAGALTRLCPGVPTRIQAPHAGDRLDISAASGVIFTGSTEDFAPSDPIAAPQRAAMEAALSSGLPVFGSCNGMQLAALVLGGSLETSPTFELGLARDITLTEVGRVHPIYAEKPSVFAAPALHRDRVGRLPAAGVCLAGNAHSPVQAFAYETQGVQFWGTQYHPELSPSQVADIFAAREGIFDQAADLVPDLRAIAAGDRQAAARWGTTPEAQADRTRMSELAAFLRVTGFPPLDQSSKDAPPRDAALGPAR